MIPSADGESSAPDDDGTGALDSPDVSLRHVSELMLLSALREQDAAAAADAARSRAQFLSDASLRFGASLDQELTYAAIAAITLPGLDAWCIVDIVETGGGVRRLAVIHPDEEKQAVARGLVERWRPATDDTIGVPAVARNRQSLIVTEEAEAAVTATVPDGETLRVLRWLGAGSLLVVPILAHDTLLGAITFVSRPGAPAYTADEVALGEALAARCGQALESARLYAAARAAWAAADAARADAEAARQEADVSRIEAELANATKAKFLGSMSHELRTPLNAIGGYAQLLEMGIHGPVTPEQLTDLASIQRSQAHLIGLVDAILTYAQIGAGRIVYNTRDISLAEVVADVESFIAPQMRAKQLHFSFAFSDHPVIVRAEAAKVRQIVLNLVGNATKFTPIGGRITVSCSDEPMLVGDGDDQTIMFAVRVSDTGTGIPADQLESVFDPFVQVSRRAGTSEVGVGLGLAISRELARGMGGDVTLERSTRDGSIFVLTLPKAVEPQDRRTVGL